MKNDFTTYEQAVALKELDFNEPCVCLYDEDMYLFSVREQDDIYDYWTPAPSYSQAFRWFRAKYNLHSNMEFVKLLDNGWLYKTCNLKEYTADHDVSKGGFKTYEEAESACLDKLIEIVKK